MNYLIIGKMRIVFFLITLSFLACGTDQGSTDTYTYIVQNQSGVGIKIIGYVTFTNVEEYVINLKNGEEISKVFKDGLPPRGYSWNSFFGSSNGNSGADSIKVIYNNVKFKDFNFDNLSDERNPLGPNHNNGELKATYTISQEDYENAEDCNGNCE